MEDFKEVGEGEGRDAMVEGSGVWLAVDGERDCIRYVMMLRTKLSCGGKVLMENESRVVRRMSALLCKGRCD